MVYPKEVLNELKWREGRDLGRATIVYLHRGAPGDLMTISGSDIKELERSFFVTGDGMVPYHRIRKIIYENRVLYDSDPG